MNRGLNGFGNVQGQSLTSPNLVGTPVAPTATPQSGSTQIATTAYVDRAASGYAFDVVGLQSANFRRTQKALANVQAGLGNMKLAFIGDSTSNGYATTYAQCVPKLVTDILAAKSGLVASFDFCINTNDARVTAGSGWGTNGVTAWGTGWLGGVSTAGNWSYTPTKSFDNFRVYYLRQSNSGTFTVNVDGGSSLGTVNTVNGSNAMGSTAFSVSAGTHTINIATSTGGYGAYLAGVETWLSTESRINVVNGSVSGTRSTFWVNNTNVYDALKLFDTYQPDLTVMMFGINDAADGVEVDTHVSRMTTIATKALTYGGFIAASAYPSDTASWEALEKKYAPALASAMPAAGAGFVDVNGRFGTYAQANALGYMNGYHGTFLGDTNAARAIAAAVLSI